MTRAWNSWINLKNGSKIGKGLLVVSATPWEARIYRVDAPTAERTLLETVEPSEKAGSTQNVRLAYAVDSKTYIYNTVRVPGRCTWWKDWNMLWSIFVTCARMMRLANYRASVRHRAPAFHRALPLRCPHTTRSHHQGSHRPDLCRTV